MPGFHSITWFGLVAPPGTPTALADGSTATSSRFCKQQGGRRDAAPDLARGRRDDALLTLPKFFADETALWCKVIKEAGIQPQ